MTSGSRTRRAAGGVAALTIAALAGCHGGVQVARMATAPNRPESVLATAGRAALLPATVALDSPSEMGAIEPSGATAGMTEPASPAIEAPASTARLASAAPTIPAPTPLLDAALAKSEAIAGVVADEMATPAALPAIAREPAARPKPDVVEPPAPPAVAVADPVPPEPLRPEEIWRDEIHRLVDLARSRREKPGDEPGPWDLRARVLEWLAGPEIDPDLGHREPDGVRAVLRALDEPARPSRARGDDLRAAVRVLEDRAPLELADLRLCSRVDSFGDYETFDPPARKAGQSVVIYAEVDGLRHESTEAGFRTRLAGQVEIVAEDGSLVLARPYGPAEEVCRRRRRDYFVPYKLVLPKTIAPGTYRLRLSVKDLLADRSASREVAFAILRD